MINNVSETVKRAAAVEVGLFEDKKSRSTVQGNNVNKCRRNKQKNMPISALLNKVVDLNEEPIVYDLSTKILPRTCRTTNGWFTITYNPAGSPKLVPGKPYTIGQDLIRGRFCVSGPKHFYALCDRIPEFAFIKKWSYFDVGLFALAKKHPGVAFSFNFKWVEYGDMIEKKAEERGIDIDHKPFFMYITRKEKLDQLRKEYKMYPNPTVDDYKTVLDEIDKEGVK